MADTTSLQKRLLQDIREIQEKPYPGIAVHLQDDQLTKACLILTPENESPLHLTIHFTASYPLDPPRIKIESAVTHPNVFDDYICINILNHDEAYTPAYSLKGICIQMLSFFASDHVEQMYGENGGVVDRKQYQADGWKNDPYGRRGAKEDNFKCGKCGFDARATSNSTAQQAVSSDSTTGDTVMTGVEPAATTEGSAQKKKEQKLFLKDLPQEIVLTFCDYLDEESLLLAARAWNGFGRVMRTYNILRTRELQCFTFKRGFKELELGIGVTIDHTQQGRNIASEFDLLSRLAFDRYNVRQSIQGLPFHYWLPLPLSHNHWIRVRGDVDNRLDRIAKASNINGTLDNVVYAFMNDIVVRLSRSAEEIEKRAPRLFDEDEPKSTLTHVSEKAIESYFHLFHLLVCLVTDRKIMATRANDAIKNFLNGRRSKQDCPNLGYLLIMSLISDVEDTEELNKAIIEEAVTRNVVWMLEPEPKGRGMIELSYMEPSAISFYRLAMTFQASKTSYRLIMFLNLMRKVLKSVRHVKNPQDGTVKKLNLDELRTALFSRHGAPPNGAAAILAKKVQEIQKVNDFPNFLTNMGVQPGLASKFTEFLRKTVNASMEKGYSKPALTQEEALYYRLAKEPEVERQPGMGPKRYVGGRPSFFPGRGGAQGGGRGGGGRGGRGRGRGGRY